MIDGLSGIIKGLKIPKIMRCGLQIYNDRVISH